ncbi:MAG: serine hydrolase [Pseudoxanthomonas sp.]
MKQKISRIALALGASIALFAAHAGENVSQVPAEVQTLRRIMLNPDVSTLTLRNMDQLYDTRVVGRSGPVWQLPAATHDIDFSYTLPNGETHKASEFADRTYTDALLIIKNGKIVHEYYANGMRDYQRHMAWSMTKSLTSLAVGQAVQDGLVKLDERIDKYLPELAKGGYAGVTVRQVLDMTSGVDYEERYDFENPGIAAKNHERALVKNEVRFADAAIDIKRKQKPGAKFEYKTLDTAVLGWMLERVTGQTISAYFSQHVWQPLGTEYDGFFIMDGPVGVGREFTGAGFNGTLRDFGRIGLMMLHDGYANGHQIVSKKWVDESTKPAGPEEGPPGSPGGYGYQWWTITGPSEAYTAIGLAGQYIYIDKANDTVVVKLSHLPLDEKKYMEASIEIGVFLGAASAWKPQ